jgi:hypothetical protein
MAKQSFSVGQVLTAAQMTSLQQTAMLGGSTTAKTTSYTLVAADAGTVVSVNSTSATTITINTGLFVAGDTVTIQNWGSGAVTITAGTATVNTAGSLIVPQYDGGVLYFTSASAAIYFDFVQAGAVSPLTTKGDLYTFASSDTRLGVGANNTVLTADSAEATGLKWASPAGGGMTLINAGGTTLTGASTTVSSIPGTYNELVIYITNVKVTTSGHGLACRFNGDSTANRHGSIETSGGAGNVPFNSTQAFFAADIWNAGTTSLIRVVIPQYANTSVFKYIHGAAMINYSSTTANMVMFNWMGIYNQTTAITSLEFRSQSHLTGGTVYVYGVK